MRRRAWRVRLAAAPDPLRACRARDSFYSFLLAHYLLRFAACCIAECMLAAARELASVVCRGRDSYYSYYSYYSWYSYVLDVTHITHLLLVLLRRYLLEQQPGSSQVCLQRTWLLLLILLIFLILLICRGRDPFYSSVTRTADTLLA